MIGFRFRKQEIYLLYYFAHHSNDIILFSDAYHNAIIVIYQNKAVTIVNFNYYVPVCSGFSPGNMVTYATEVMIDVYYG